MEEDDECICCCGGGVQGADRAAICPDPRPGLAPEEEGDTKLPRNPGAFDGSTETMAGLVSIVVVMEDDVIADPVLVFVELKADPRAATVAKFNF